MLRMSLPPEALRPRTMLSSFFSTVARREGLPGFWTAPHAGETGHMSLGFIPPSGYIGVHANVSWTIGRTDPDAKGRWAVQAVFSK